MSEKVILCILDGFGIGDRNYQYNAVFQAKTPNFQRFLGEYPNAMLETSGLAVGLPEGQMGNSEVGHMTIGSGRVIFQDLPKIDQSIEDGTLEKKLKTLKTTGTVHIFGLCSNGGVHALLSHIRFIYKTFENLGKKVVLHVITDGRDVPPQSFLQTLGEFDGLNIGTICGRFFAMDRDNKTERTQAFFDAMLGKAPQAENIEQVLKQSYAKNITDEFIQPHILQGFEGIHKGDTFFVANFRADRARQITNMAIQSKMFEKIITITELSEEISKNAMVLFKKEHIKNTLVEILEANQKKHLHIAETEKYAHVTFFFNGGNEQAGQFEKQILVPSPNVKTYDIQPEMSIYTLQRELIQEIDSKQHDFIVINIANGDMVGHTGCFESAKKAAEHVDVFLGGLEKSVLDNGYHLLITADHGNLEEMVDKQTGEIHTQHTTLPVPIVYISNSKKQIKNGSLANIAGTVLKLMQISKPDEIAESLI